MVMLFTIVYRPPRFTGRRTAICMMTLSLTKVILLDHGEWNKTSWDIKAQFLSSSTSGYAPLCRGARESTREPFHPPPPPPPLRVITWCSGHGPFSSTTRKIVQYGRIPFSERWSNDLYWRKSFRVIIERSSPASPQPLAAELPRAPLSAQIFQVGWLPGFY